MVIRFMEWDELDSVNQLYEAVYGIHSERRPDIFKKNLTRVYTKEFVEDEDIGILVAEDNGKICGFAAFYLIVIENNNILTDRTTLRVEEICISEAYRNKGIGKMLMECIREIAEEQGCYDITLYVYDCNKDAKRFYESIGMKVRSSVMEWIV